MREKKFELDSSIYFLMLMEEKTSYIFSKSEQTV